MERRILGRTGQELSIVGCGGVAVVGMTQAESDAFIGEVIDAGVNYFDVAPSYGREQETEKRFGPSLKPHRDSIFLACKTGRRDKEGAQEELDRSLQHLETDYFDLYQLHAITTVEDVERAFAPGGAMEVFQAARDAGKVRYLGFSAHSVEAAFLAMEKFSFDSALFPINFVTMFEGKFGQQIIERAIQNEVARLALKAMARTNWTDGAERGYPHCWYEPMDDPHFSELAVRFTLSQSITAAVPPGDPRLVRRAIEYAQRFTPITEVETEELRRYAKGLKPIFAAAA